jgi:hypothetical protein
MVEGQLKPWLAAVAGQVHEHVCGFSTNWHAADFLKTKGFVEGNGPL